MNNRFKFRICHESNGHKTIIYPPDNRFMIGLDGKVYENYKKRNDHGAIDNLWEEVFDADNVIIQQFTGCHDSSNKEIYEGDIIKYNNGDVVRIGYIGFMTGIFFLNYSDETDDELGYLLVSNITIIGNIFENSELLK